MMFLCSLLLSTATLRAKAPEGSLQKQMEWLHATHHVDFVYDAAIDVKQPYHGPTLRGLTLEKALATLFQGTGIGWSREGRYVILKQEKSGLPAAKPTENPARQRRFTVSGYVKDSGGESLINATVYDLTTRQERPPTNTASIPSPCPRAGTGCASPTWGSRNTRRPSTSRPTAA